MLYSPPSPSARGEMKCLCVCTSGKMVCAIVLRRAEVNVTHAGIFCQISRISTKRYWNAHTEQASEHTMIIVIELHARIANSANMQIRQYGFVPNCNICSHINQTFDVSTDITGK